MRHEAAYITRLIAAHEAAYIKLITESGDGCLRRCVAAKDALKKTGLLEDARAIELELNLFVNNLEVDGSQLGANSPPSA